MGVQVSIFTPLDKYPEMELLGHMLILFLILVSAPIYIPTNSTHSFPFLHILSSRKPIKNFAYVAKTYSLAAYI